MPQIRSHEEALSVLIAARKSAGLTQERLAQLVGVRQSAIGNYESGSNRLSVARLIEIADALGFDVALLPRAERNDLAVAAERLAASSDPALSAAAVVILNALLDRPAAQ